MRHNIGAAAAHEVEMCAAHIVQCPIALGRHISYPRCQRYVLQLEEPFPTSSGACPSPSRNLPDQVLHMQSSSSLASFIHAHTPSMHIPALSFLICCWRIMNRSSGEQTMNLLFRTQIDHSAPYLLQAQRSLHSRIGTGIAHHRQDIACAVGPRRIGVGGPLFMRYIPWMPRGPVRC